jgi:DNA-binding transcriptional ArsR family regulator
VATDRASNGLTALGDPTRRLVFELLATHPRSVGELAAELPVSRPAVSQHLRVLKDAGLVNDRADGTRRIYRVDPDGVAGLRDYLDGFWNRSLAAFKRAAESPPDTPSPVPPQSKNTPPPGRRTPAESSSPPPGKAGTT